MQDRRIEPRMLCADLVKVEWRDESGRSRKSVANLEDISLSGACLQLDDPIPLHTTLRIRHSRVAFLGTTRYCVYREIGYFIGVQFDPGTRWSEKLFKPMHLLDPRTLVGPEEGKDLVQ